MKKTLKKLGTALLLILIGAVIYFVSATVYYRTTGDDRHSGTLGLRCAMIYVIALLIDGFVRRVRRMNTEGVLFGYSDRPAGYVSTRRRGVNNTAAWLYGSVLAVLISFMLYYIVPEGSPLEDVTLWANVIAAFLTVICAVLYIILRLSANSGDRSDTAAAQLHTKLAELYGEHPEQKLHIEREYSYKDLCVALAAVFGAGSSVYNLIDRSTGRLREGVTYDEVLERVDSDPKLLPVYNFFFHSPQAMRTEINLLCERSGIGISISDQELEDKMRECDSGHDVRRRIDYQLPWIHDMNVIDRILRSKGYALIYITGYFTDNEEILTYYETGEEPEDDFDFDDDVTERKFITVCPTTAPLLASRHA